MRAMCSPKTATARPKRSWCSDPNRRQTPPADPLVPAAGNSLEHATSRTSVQPDAEQTPCAPTPLVPQISTVSKKLGTGHRPHSIPLKFIFSKNRNQGYREARSIAGSVDSRARGRIYVTEKKQWSPSLRAVMIDEKSFWFPYRFSVRSTISLGAVYAVAIYCLD